MAVKNKRSKDGKVGIRSNGSLSSGGVRAAGHHGLVPQREAVERPDKTHKEEEMIVTGYRADGSRAMIVTDDPVTLAWFAERFERTEYKAFNKGGKHG